MTENTSRDVTVGRRAFVKTLGVAVGASVAGLPRAGSAQQKAPAFPKGTKLSLLKPSIFPGPIEDEETKKLAAEWKQLSGVEVTIESLPPNDLQARTSTHVELKAGPDVIFMIHNWPHLYAEGLVDVSDLAEELGAKYGGYYTDAKAHSFVKGKWLAVPYNVLPNAWAYRTDWFSEIGVKKFPDTWDELRKVGKQLKAKGRPLGQALGHSFADPVSFVYPVLWSFGGKELAPDGKTVVIESKETIAALEFASGFWKDAFDEGGLAWDDTANNRAFLGGQLSATLNGASIYIVAKRDFKDLAPKIGHAPNPAGPAGRFHFNTTVEFAILKSSKNVGAAKAFIRWIMDTPQYSRWLEGVSGYYTGPTKHWERHAIWEKERVMVPIREAGKHGRVPGYAGPSSRAASEAISKYIVLDMFAKTVSGEPAKKAAQWAANELRQIYKG
jgi:multiple sugar transport system substrate-binding protein